MPSVKKIADITKWRVACGCCEKSSTTHKGFRSIANKNIRIACGKCVSACTADIISLWEVKSCE